ncbi:MAG: T9SS type A sorting domain-containing protein [Bacteroidetes bacterium]|nr:T9SS type A sorting domain-containing protein [Bacteroidota bacterium]
MKISSLAFILCFLSYSAISQFAEPHVCKSLPDCAHTKINASIKSGTYEQNPGLWDYDVSFYGISLDVEPTSTDLIGSTRIKAKSNKNNLSSFVVELMNDLTVDNVKYTGGSDLSFNHTNNEIIISLTTPVNIGQIIDITIEYSGTPEPSGFFSGIQSAYSNTGHPVLWTLSEPLNARKWFPVKQVLEDKADSVYVFITTPNEYIAASNGILYNVIDAGGNKMRYEWKSYYPIAYYLISIAVSDYQEYNFYAPLATVGEEVFVQNFLYNDDNYINAIMNNLMLTKDYMSAFSILYGNYPFAEEKYGHASAPMGGAMEHQTMSTMGSFNPDIISHELAHHWFGNNVTCATWSDIWINEGFASYSEYLAREFVFGKEHANLWMESAHTSILALPGGSVYVPPLETVDVWRIFSGRLSYKKGAAILHILRSEINDDDLFFEVLRSFNESFKDSVATGDDFREVLENITGQQWEWFFNQWYYGEGYPIFQIIWYQLENTLFINSIQSGSVEYPEFFKATLEFDVVYDDYSTQKIRLLQETNGQILSHAVSGNVIDIIFDPGKILFKQFSISTINENIQDAKTLIFPNPFSNELRIILPYDSMNIECKIYNIEGINFISQKLDKNINSVNTDFLPDGIFLVKIISSDGKTIHRQKVIKINK